MKYINWEEIKPEMNTGEKMNWSKNQNNPSGWDAFVSFVGAIGLFSIVVILALGLLGFFIPDIDVIEIINTILG